MSRINGPRLLADLRRLAEFGKFGSGVDRIAFSTADREARAWLVGRMRDAGLVASIDAVGNVCGVTPGVHRAVVMGSHTDTVPKGGWLDGAMGVIYGLEIARSRIESGAADLLGVDVLSFQDEEGTFLPFLGSKSFCGELDSSDIGRARSPDNRSLADSIAEAGYTGAPFRRDPSRHIAYLEGHIEQGPRLEAARLRLGVVTGIVGIRRFRIVTTGQADHAGTTPIPLRKDAVRAAVAIAHWVHETLPRLASAETVWNVGVINVKPNAANVVPAAAEIVVEFRDLSIELLDHIERELLATVQRLDGKAGVSVAAAPIARIEPTLMADRLQELIEGTAQSAGIASMRMPSGAGHDAMTVGRHMPAGMLFIPSIGGRSHDIVEDTPEADIVLGCDILAGVVDALA